eukprot:CAMPEP_0116562022 /NCGR_PEP_ID=MMETSP0397-20121206/11919_1 /TAXON_ID=216820 /ORGANISM="Cyclophora tenuis, Strain ECT3854" /LENGTH=94 /DNA_ID=CAMNT_0004088253 /DNA_START=14 /DNA_END=298 /DNA_ORIENTATION=-
MIQDTNSNNNNNDVVLDSSGGSCTNNGNLNSNDKNIVGMTRTLRRMKRRMFLKAVEQPQTPVDSFREMMLKVALEESRSFSDVSSSSLYRIAEE